MANDRYVIQAVAKASAVLKTVAESREPMTVAEIVEGLDSEFNMDTNAVFRMCETLDSLHWLNRVGDRSFEIGMGLAVLWARKRARMESVREQAFKDLNLLVEPSEMLKSIITELAKVAAQLKVIDR